MVALLAGLSARLDSTERAVAAPGILRGEGPTAKPFGWGGALLESGPRPLGIGS